MSHVKATLMPVMGIAGLIVVLVLAQGAPPASAVSDNAPHSTQTRVETVSGVGGHVLAVDVVGNRAFTGEGTRLVVLDVADPQSPREIARLELGGGIVGVIEASGHHASVATLSGELFIVDASDPTAPHVVGEYRSANSNSGGAGVDLKQHKGYAYMALASEGLHVVDVRDPTSLTLAASLPTKGSALGVDVSADDIAFVVTGWGTLHVYDVDRPGEPREIGRNEYGSGETFVGIAYNPSCSDVIVLGWYGLYTFDVTDVRDPRLLTAQALDDNHHRTGTYRAVVKHGLAYVALDGAGLRMYHLACWEQPSEIATHNSPWLMARGISLADGLAYVADEQTGIEIVDVSDVMNPSHVGDYDAPISGSVRDLRVVDVRAYVLHGLNPTLLSTFLLGDPESVTLVGEIQNSDDWNLFVHDGHLYGVENNQFLIHLVDANRSPTTLQEHRAANAGFVTDEAFAEGYAFLASPETAMSIWRIDGPSSWVEMAEYPVFDPEEFDQVIPTAIDASGGRLYAMSRWASGDHESSAFQILDVGEPTAPAELGRLEIDGAPGALLVDPPIAFAFAGPPFGLLIVDVSDPAQPRLLSRVADVSAGGPYSSHGRAVLDEGQLFILSSDLHIVDVSQPSMPVSYGSVELPCEQRAVEPAGNVLLVACHGSGMIVTSRPRISSWESLFLPVAQQAR